VKEVERFMRDSECPSRRNPPSSSLRWKLSIIFFFESGLK